MSSRAHHPPPTLRIVWALCALALALSTLLAGGRTGRAEGCVVVPSRHAWGAFKLGSWKRVRVLSQTFDDEGEVASTRVTETKSSLVQVDSEGYTLLVEVKVELAGREFDNPPRYVRCSFSGEGEDDHVSYEDLQPATVTIGEKQILSRVQRIVASSGATKRISLVHYSQEVSPFLLKRSTVSLDTKTDSELGKTVVEVLDTSLMRQVLSRRMAVSRVKTTRSYPGGRSETEELYSPEVPGGVVSHTSSQFDEDGRLASSSDLELLGYGVGDGRQRLFPRLFPRLRRRQ